MDIGKQILNPNPKDTANPISQCFFWYTIDMFRKGYTKVLEVADLYNPLTADRSTLLGDRIENKWQKHMNYRKKRGKQPNFLIALIQTFWLEYLKLGLVLMINDIPVRLTQPLMLGKLLDYFGPDSTVTREEALIYAGVIVALNGVSAIFINQYVMGAFHVGMKVRAACCALIYRKALKLSRTALGETASGKVVNLLSNDVSRFDIVSIFIHHMWIAPTITVIVAYFLWVDAGYAGLIGIATVFVVVPLQGYTGKLSSRFRLQTAYRTDERVRLMDEIISGVQVIKMYAWEKPFAKLIKLARKLELKIITKTSYVRGLYMTFNLFTTRVALFAALLTMVLMDQEVSATKVFVFASYFNLLAHSMSSMFVRGISEVAEVLVAIKRLQKFLLSDEYEDIAPIENNNINNQRLSKISLHLENISAIWNESRSDYTLSDFNLEVEKGKLIGVIGPVGAGKSSLLQLILGELRPKTGSIFVNGKLSYAGQDAWVFASTIRQNIIFGQAYNSSRYKQVIKACALEKDFKQFPDGDQTVVGDRGASLSGGQKARINLARAIYRDADIYLLDDPLSAVDTHVAKHLYEECITGYLGRKTRILITHQVQHLKDADHIIIMNNGKIDMQGTYQDLGNSDDIYAQLLSQEQEQTEEEKQISINAARTMRQQSVRSKSNSITSTLSESTSSIVDSIEKTEVKKLDFEDTSKGKVEGNLMLQYMMGGGNICFGIIVMILFLLAQLAASGADFWVSFWTQQEDLRKKLNDTPKYAAINPDLPEPLPTDLCLYIYGGIVISIFVIAITRSMSFYKLCMRSSQNLHDKMFYSIVNTNMLFFNTNPSGRILNRFSKDIGAVDELLPKVLLDSAQIILSMLGCLILTIYVNPYLLIPCGVIGILFWLLRVVFLKTSKNIKRLEGITRSPVFTHLNATLNGLTTIRAYGAQDILRDEFDKHQDLHSSAWFMYISSSSAFGFALDILCFVFTALVTFSFLISSESDISGGSVGLAITQATALTGLLQWGIRQSAEVANQLMSVERVIEYTQLPSESQPILPKTPQSTWPQHGRIKFRNAGLRYAQHEPLVLKNLNFNIEPKEKIGIVGRTGAGKSSLISAIFLLADVEGQIEIDGVDTKELILQYLRSKVSIIPQDPVLFSGTLRRNLDPFEEYNDAVLWRALEEVELKDIAETNNLESRVLDRGANYSVGQRQLICLARAIVRNNKILMLDEATANVDPQTDALIQRTIRQKFADCTVLTVAHRLNTIMDSDRVLVMQNGCMEEFDHPHTLLQNPKGIFTKMVAEAGNPLSEQLKRTAKENYERRHKITE